MYVWYIAYVEILAVIWLVHDNYDVSMDCSSLYMTTQIRIIHRSDEYGRSVHRISTV